MKVHSPTWSISRSRFVVHVRIYDWHLTAYIIKQVHIYFCGAPGCHAMPKPREKKARWRTDADTKIVRPSWLTDRVSYLANWLRKAQNLVGAYGDKVQKFGHQATGLVVYMWPSLCPRDGLNLARNWSSLLPPWHDGGCMGLLLYVYY